MADANYQKVWRERNPEKVKAHGRRHRLKHLEQERQRNRRFAKSNRSLANARWKRWYHSKGRNQRKNDYTLKIKRRLHRRLSDVLRRAGIKKTDRIIPLLGCSIASFIVYIESRFEVGMSWDNYGKWEIDHILPCALFDLSNPEHRRRCFHFSNLQPLWAVVNRRKGKRIFHEADCLPL